MNKRQLIQELSIAFGTTYSNAKSMLETFTSVIENGLLSGQEVNIHGFGKFSTTIRKQRVWHNPQTREPMIIESNTLPVFKAGTPLKNKIREKFKK